MSKHIRFGLFAAILVLTLTPAAAQDAACSFDFSDVIALLEGSPTLDDVAQARSMVVLQEASCRDHAPDSAGDSRTNPVPFGQRSTVTLTSNTLAAIQLIEFLDDGEDYVRAVNSRNERAPDGMRYIVFRIQYTCDHPPDESCEFSRVDYSVVGSSGISYRYNSASGFGISIRDIGQSREIFGGAEIEADLAFLVPEDDSSFVLFTEYGRPRAFFASEGAG